MISLVFSTRREFFWGGFVFTFSITYYINLSRYFLNNVNYANPGCSKEFQSV